ncbi:MAG: VCBS repeat-containing protein, partial [Coriobacteriia bacterium]|nr:VCBS repeat-containing protein [Coriobacteriia bacterium]
MAAIVFAVLGGPAVASAGVVGLPGVNGLASPTHPDDATWYPTRSVSFSWEATKAFDGYSFAFDGAATAPTLDVMRDGLMPRFSEGASTPVGPTEPWSMPRLGYQAVADFNGDGILDLAEAGGTRLYVLLGKGDGTFEAKLQPPGSSPYVSLAWNSFEFDSREIVAADFDKDGLMDLVLAGHSANAEYLVLNGAGDGTFAISGRDASGWLWYSPSSGRTTGRSITTADFDGDSNLDIAMSLESSPGVVAVYPGNGNGTFGAGTALRMSGTVQAWDVLRDLATGDLDADGRPELVGVVGEDANARIAIWDNVGGALATPSALNVLSPRAHSKVEVAEMDGDGAPEIVAASNDNDYFQPGVTIYHGSLAGGFTSTGLAPLSYESLTDLKVIDLNADGLLDVVGLNSFAYNSEGRSGVEWYLNDGSGGFTGPFRHRAYENSLQQFSVGDFDGN